MADLMNPNVSEKERRTFEAFRRYLIPLAGVVETIATQGKSPGTTAMAAEQNFQNQEDRRRQMLQDEENRQAAALERAMKGKQQELYTEQLAGAKEERERGAKERSSWEAAVSADQNLSPTEKAAMLGAGGKAYLDYVLGGRKQESGVEGLMARLLTQKEIAGMNIGSREKIAGEQIGSKEKIAGESAQIKKEATAAKGQQKTDAAEEVRNNLLTQIDIVKNHPGKYSGVAAGQVLSFLPTESRDFKKQVDKLKSLLTLQNLKYLKGNMSDKDVQFIRQASTALDLGGKPEALERELDRIRNYVGTSTPSTGVEGKGTSFDDLWTKHGGK